MSKSPPRLSPGIIVGSYQLFCWAQDYSLSLASLSANHSHISGTATSDVLLTAQKCEWIIINEDAIELSKMAQQYVHGLNDNVRRSMLFDYISKVRPAWASLLTKGRSESVPFLPADIKACFYDANLMKIPLEENVILWWDEIARILYEEKDQRRIAIGRHGEKLSMDYELKRISRKPVWQSIESNIVGYDILSKIALGNSAPLLIEVKASTDSLESATAYITKNEWDTACNSNYYLFHFWLLQKQPKLAVISKEQLQKNIPTNSGAGEWERVSVPFSIFAELFEVV